MLGAGCIRGHQGDVDHWPVFEAARDLKLLLHRVLHHVHVRRVTARELKNYHSLSLLAKDQHSPRFDCIRFWSVGHLDRGTSLDALGGTALCVTQIKVYLGLERLNPGELLLLGRGLRLHRRCLVVDIQVTLNLNLVLVNEA